MEKRMFYMSPLWKFTQTDHYSVHTNPPSCDYTVLNHIIYLLV